MSTLQPPPPWADLHCHTLCSDGALSPTELLTQAQAQGLGAVAITDHDTYAAYEEAIPMARALGLGLGSGIEFSSLFESYDLHILGYDFDLTSTDMAEFCRRHAKRRRLRYEQMVHRLHQEGLHLDLPPASPEKIVGRLHLAHLLVEKGYVRSTRDAFKRYLGRRGKCYVPGHPFSLPETLEVIHAARGRAFLAHPHLLSAACPLDRLLQYPWDGVECGYAKMLPATNAPWRALVESKGWMASGGSDFHAPHDTQHPLGCQGVDAATFSRIFSKPLVEPTTSPSKSVSPLS